MTTQPQLVIHTGTIIEEDSLTLGQLCRACGTHAEWVISLVEESIIEAEGEEISSWRFSGSSLVRTRSALRLHRDLGVNLAGIALVLNLMEELESKRSCPLAIALPPLKKGGER